MWLTVVALLLGWEDLYEIGRSLQDFVQKNTVIPSCEDQHFRVEWVHLWALMQFKQTVWDVCSPFDTEYDRLRWTDCLGLAHSWDRRAAHKAIRLYDQLELNKAVDKHVREQRTKMKGSALMDTLYHQVHGELSASRVAALKVTSASSLELSEEELKHYQSDVDQRTESVVFREAQPSLSEGDEVDDKSRVAQEADLALAATEKEETKGTCRRFS